MKVFHISEKPITNTMTPRIPESEYEDQKTPRICFAKTIQGCIIGHYENKNVIGKKLYVYSTMHEYYEPTTKQVSDKAVTGEVWILEPIIPKLEGIIEITKIKDYNLYKINKDVFKVPVYEYKFLK